MQRGAQILLFLAVVASVAACTTRKDGFSYRVFHNTTARYNGYFYAKEAMRESHLTLEENNKDDYDEVLKIFVYGTEEDAEAIFPLMERAIEKSSRVIDRHKMEPTGRSKKSSKRPEMNKWIDDNYLLIGQGYFYKRNYLKAEEMFIYVSRKYKEKNMQAKANTWLARCYIQREQYTKAKNTILKAVQMRDLEEEVRVDVHLVYADYLIHQEQWKEAAEQIEFALRYIKKKRDKARPTFILAQLMQRQNKSQEAISLYNAVLKLRPKYEMEFYAQIMQAMAFDRRGGNSQRIKDILFDLLEDEKNEEYQDIIYYALAEIALEEQKREAGIGYLKDSVGASKGNKKQKMKSFLRLADLHLEDRDYPMAQAYYDSTFRNMEEDHPRYLEVQNKSESLNELVAHLNVIAHNDSIAGLCAMDEEELVAKLESIRKQMEEEREAARRAAEEALAAGNQTSNAGQGAFWPYNPQLRESGRMNFMQYWGDRPLEDHWRRRNKMTTNFNSDDESEVQEEVQEVADQSSSSDELPSVDEMLAALPCSQPELDSAFVGTAEAYYRSGIVYREKLEDLENAIEQWEVLVTKYDESEFHPTAYYLLFRTYLTKENAGYQNPFCGTCSSTYWGDIILDRYPGTEFALLVQNPDYLDVADIRKQEEREAYAKRLSLYYARSYQELLLQTNQVIEEEPENHLLCKYKLLNAMAIGGLDAMTGSRNNHIQALERVVNECPQTEEASFAAEQLKKLRGEVQAGNGDPKEEAEEETPALNVSPYAYDDKARHYFMLVLPLKGSDVNQVKAELSDFAGTNFKTLNLKVSSNLIDRNNQVVLVKTFNKLDDANSFYSLFDKSEKMQEIREMELPYALISKENYVTLFKTKDMEGYQQFFLENYQP